jgi:hypothetical protein
MQTFNELLGFIKQVAGGIFDALVAGKWELAGQIVVAALKVSWQTGIGGLKLIWVEFKTWMLKLLASIGEALGTVGEWIFGEGFANEIKIGAELLREEATTGHLVAPPPAAALIGSSDTPSDPVATAIAAIKCLTTQAEIERVERALRKQEARIGSD